MLETTKIAWTLMADAHTARIVAVTLVIMIQIASLIAVRMDFADLAQFAVALLSTSLLLFCQ